MSGFLDIACAESHRRVADAAAREPLEAVRDRASGTAVPLSFGDALASRGVSVIAEIKRASPSRGHLADIPDPAALAAAYEGGGAAAVSVLTEPQHFRGSLDDLQAVASAVQIPALRKDFLVDPYQVWEARAAGAAAVLLIVAALSDTDLAALLAEAWAARLDVLIETHDADEIARAAAAHSAAGAVGPLIVGVNARDLKSLAVDGERFAQLRSALPAAAISVAESGIRGPADVTRLAALGADAVLVGESVATAADPGAAVRALAQAGVHDVSEVTP